MADSPAVERLSLRTPTLAPATHTNVWLLGAGEITVVDPASPYDDERATLHARLAERIGRGERVARLLLTHHHHDHVGGALALRAFLQARGLDAPIAAHPANTGWLPEALPIDEPVADGVLIDGWRALHTPGHAPGHLVLHHEPSGEAVAGDLVAGVGTILIGPDDGHLGTYLASLDRVRAAGVQRLHPAHGPSLEHAEQVLAFYIAHRHQRSAAILEALDRLGEASAEELAPRVYAELHPSVLPVAAVQIGSHLRWLGERGAAFERAPGRWARR